MCDLIRKESDQIKIGSKLKYSSLEPIFLFCVKELTKKSKSPVAGERKSVFDSVTTVLTVKRFFATAQIL